MTEFVTADWYWEPQQNTSVRVHYVRDEAAHTHLYIHGDIDVKLKKYTIRLNEMNAANTIADDKIIAGP